MKEKISQLKLLSAQSLKTNTMLQISLILLAGGILAAGVLVYDRVKNVNGSVSMASVRPLSECAGSSEFKCYSEYFDAKTEATDPQTAFTDLKQAYEVDSYAKSQCHQLAHVIGRKAFDKYGSLAGAYPRGDSFCWSGYHHGITERAIGKLGNERIRSEANEVCAELAQKSMYSFDHYNCVHGLGHGFMSVENYDLFKTLSTCDLLTNDWDRESCYGGAYMENVMVEARGDGKSNFLRSEEPMYPCTAVDSKYKQQCYLMQTSYALQQNGYNFAETFRLCRDVADKDFTVTCYQSIGRDASGSTVSDVVRTKANCDNALDSTGLEQCMLGAVRDFVSYFHSDQQAKQLCEAFGGDLNTRCQQEVVSYYSTF